MQEELKIMENAYYQLKTTADTMNHNIAIDIGVYDSVFKLKDKINNQKKDIEEKQNTLKKPVRFLQHSVTNGVDKVRVWYYGSVDENNEIINITIYAKDYGNKLSSFFNNVKNETDITTDYFDTDRVIIDKKSEHWEAAKATYNKVQASLKKKMNKK